MRLWRIASPLVLAISLGAMAVLAYTPFQDRVNGVVYPSRWTTSEVTWRYFRPASPPANVDTSSGTNPVAADTAVARGFDVWDQTQLNGQTLTSLVITRGSDLTSSSARNPDSSDCRNVVSLAPSSSVAFSTGTIAQTYVTTMTGTPPFNYTCTTGSFSRTATLPSVIVDADMMFNPAQPFSTSTPPLADHFDVQSMAGHEAGHVLGLDHNGIAHTMMYPYGDTGDNQQRNLGVDDVVGVAFLYPSAVFTAEMRTISGTVSLNGTGAFAAHLVVVERDSGVVVVDGLSTPDGTYRIEGVPPGTYRVLALPLSGVYTLGNFIDWACGYASDQAACTGIPQNPTDYTGTFH
jgi:hypothetical protein